MTRDPVNLLEKGDASFWTRWQDALFVAWAPQDSNALSRSLATYMRRSTGGVIPDFFRLIAPFFFRVNEHIDFFLDVILRSLARLHRLDRRQQKEGRESGKGR